MKQRGYSASCILANGYLLYTWEALQYVKALLQEQFRQTEQCLGPAGAKLTWRENLMMRERQTAYISLKEDLKLFKNAHIASRISITTSGS